MAATITTTVRLQPLDRSLLSSTATAKGEDTSSARQRRRKTTRLAGSGNLAHSQTSLESSGSPRDWPNARTGLSHTSQHTSQQSEASRGTSGIARSGTTVRLQDTYLTKSQLYGTSTARPRRSRKLGAKLKGDTSQSHAESRFFEDSTDGVASILKRKLQQLEVTEAYQASSEDDSGHTSDVGTQCEDEDLDASHTSDVGTQYGDEDVDAGRHTSDVRTQRGDGGDLGGVVEPVESSGRPLPPPACQTEDGSGSHASSATLVVCTDIMSITVHGTDELQASIFLTHPSVRVSIVDSSLEAHGLLLKKSTPERNVTSYYEGGNPSVDYILPILTKPFECRQHRALKGTLKAQWEETITFNELLSYFTSNENVVIFFELLDFVSGGRGYSSRMQSEQKPWHRIAWAFLCPAGKTCVSRIGKKIRLQLYKYPKNMFGNSTESTEVYNLWCRRYRSAYPSTLHVTLSGVSTALPQEDHSAPPTKRSLFPLQEEKGSITFEQMLQLQMVSKSFSGLTGLTTSAFTSPSMRLPGQACQIPTSHLTTQYPTPMGCSSLAFSHSGHLLAAGCADQTTLYPLVIYEIPSFKPVMVTEGHRGIIYQVCWNNSDMLLASISADGIVKLWSLDNTSLKPVATLPHPCYVYCACFVTGAEWEGSNVLATGAYDSYIRIWSLMGEDNTVQLIGEFHGQCGHVNCLIWSSKAALLYAGDSKGILGVWHRKKGGWRLKHKTDVLNGQSLAGISLHPNSRKILLHTRKAKLAMLDLRVDGVCCEYAGIQPAGLERCGSLLSPCGGLVFAGTTSGTVHVWNTETGKEVHIYSDLPFTSAIGAMAYHPTEHLLVISSFGDCQPLLALHHLVGSQPVAGQGGGAPSTSRSVVRGGGKEEGDREGARTEFLESQVKGSHRFSDLVKTLNRVTAKAKS